MFYDFIYLAKGFRMRPKVRSTLNGDVTKCQIILSTYCIILEQLYAIKRLKDRGVNITCDLTETSISSIASRSWSKVEWRLL